MSSADTPRGSTTIMVVDGEEPARRRAAEMLGASGFRVITSDNSIAALALYEQAPRLAIDYLTDYSVTQGENVVQRWKQLGEFLIWKYLDGNMKDEHGNVTHPGYREEWYRRVVEENGEHFKVRKIGEGESH